MQRYAKTLIFASSWDNLHRFVMKRCKRDREMEFEEYQKGGENVDFSSLKTFVMEKMLIFVV